jgi:putative superfamily III holin-X
MLAPSGELLRAGLALKLNHVRRATRSYVRDRANQATDKATSYAVAAGLFAVAGLFVVAACFVGLMALFRWVEFNYGLFWAFGAVGALLLVLAVVCAGIGMANLKRPAKDIPSLTSRLRVAVASPRIPHGTVKEAVKEVATTIPLVPLAPGEKGDGSRAGPARSNRNLQLGLMLAAFTLLGFAAARRRRDTRRLDA